VGDSIGEPVSLDPNVLAGHLPSLVRAQLGSVAVTDIEHLKGGYSREMWAFNTNSAEQPPGQRWILCADSAEGVVGNDSLSRVTEAALIGHVHSVGIPAPSVLQAADHDNPLDVAWFIMERLPGTAAVGPLVRNPWYQTNRQELAEQKARILADIHAIIPPANLLGASPEPDQLAPAEISRWARALQETPTTPSATLKRALSWLARHHPTPPERAAIVHGDYRTGNLLYDQTGIRGVLDWEMAHLGDPVEDLGWAQLICWRLGTGRVGALVELDEWPYLYERMGGQPVDPDSLHFWETLCSVKMSILAWRAVERTPAGGERDLLVKLHRDLGHELDNRLLRRP
jgi:aminoglycoside phosphotransferase (APT) family kinase protein